MFEYACTLDRVVDGDTVDIVIDLGFRVKTTQRVRLAGLNAPEHNTAEGQTAIAYVKDWFTKAGPLTVQSTKPGGGDKYGRFLATITSAGDSLNYDLVRDGHAKQWDGQGVKPT